MKTLYLFTALLFLSTLNCTSQRKEVPNESIIHRTFCHIFGAEQASDQICSYFSNAAENFNLPKNQLPPIKYINSCHFLNQFSAFTWFGTWINRDWDDMSDVEKQWSAHHEMAHTMLFHPQKRILATLLATLTGAMTSKLFTLRVSTSILITIISLALMVPQYARECEKEADIATARLLCKINKKDIVEKHIEALLQQTDEQSAWFYNPLEQVAYLKPIIQ